MPDNINLPNLVSHLAVNLDGVSGAIADASRQGSSMGAALGRGVNNELDALLRNLPQVHLDGDSTDLDRDLVRVHRELSQLQSQRIGIDIDLPTALRQIQTFQTQLQRLGDEHPNVNVGAATRQASRQLDELLAAARRVDDVHPTVTVDIDEDRPNHFLGLLGRLGSSGASAGKTIGLGFAKASAAIGTAVPLVANIVATLADVAPAAGVAVTGLIGVQLTSGAVKLAAVGMDDALSAALDPSKADDFDKALEKLAPNARAFAKEVHSLAPELHEVQQTVQNKAFAGLDTVLDKLAAKTLPILRRGLVDSAGSVNLMAKGVGSAAVGLSESGTLGKAIDGATKGMRNLVRVPGQVVTAVGQVGAAAAPAFNKLTSGAGKVADRVADRLSKAFKSGAMEKAINTAVDLLGRIADVASNVFSIVGSIFSAADASGGGFVGTLQQISGALAKAFASPAVQSGLKALFSTMSVVAKTVAPLLGQALGVIAPVLTKLGPPIQTLVTALGDALSPIIDALGPVLVTAAGAVGTLVTAVAPLLPVLGQLVAAVLPALTPLLDALNTVFIALAPVVTQVGEILTNTLAPILAQLPAIIAPLAAAFGDNLVVWLGILGDLLVQLSPSFTQLGISFAQLLIAATPLITALTTIATELLSHLGPAIAPVIEGMALVATVLTNLVTIVINGAVIPAFQAVSKLLTGDVAGAFKAAKTLFTNVVNAAVLLFVAFPVRIAAAVSPLPGKLASAASAAGSQLVSAVRSKLSDAVKLVSGLPGRAKSALGGLGGALVSAGASLISGFISGIQSKIPSVKSVLSTLTGHLSDWKGPAAKDAKILTPAGQLLIKGFIAGIDGTTAQLKSKLTSITKALPTNVKSGVGKTLAKATAELQKEVTKRDGVLKKLAAAQKKLDDLVAARTKAAGDITSGILSEANITTGHSDVNSVSSITVGLQQALKASKAFEANIAALKKSGLRSDLLQEIADAGVAGGSATAAALAKATPAELKKINDLQGQLATSATATGNAVGDALYGAGIKAAAGLVAGLKSQEAAIEKQMAKIANDMLKVTKKVHKTHSPSRAFYDIAVMDGEGLRQGFQSMAGKVRAAARNVAGAALDITGNAFRAPSGPQLAAVSAAAGAGGQTNNFHLYGSDANPDGILRALSWQGLVGRR